jgi:hypothetical protein
MSIKIGDKIRYVVTSEDGGSWLMCANSLRVAYWCALGSHLST